MGKQSRRKENKKQKRTILKKDTTQNKEQKLQNNRFKNNPTIKIIAWIISFLLYSGTIFYTSQFYWFKDGYTKGHFDGYKEAEQKYFQNKYPLEINVPPSFGNYEVGDNIILKFEVVNPIDHEVYINGYGVEVPPGWVFPPQESQLTCETPPEPKESRNFSIQAPRRTIHINYESIVFQPHGKQTITGEPLFASKEGGYTITFCIIYADGTKICPRQSNLRVNP